MKKVLLTLAAVATLMFAQITPLLAQDNAGGGNTASEIFLPLIQDGAGNVTVQQQGGPLVSGDGILEAISEESIAKENEVVAAGRGIDPSSLQPVSLIVELEDSANIDQIAAAVGGTVVHRYKNIFHGGSLIVGEEQTGAVLNTPGVKKVYVDELLELQTDSSPAFIGATSVWSSYGTVGKGDGVVVGVLDSGIWPEHASFADPDPMGYSFSAPPKGTGGYGCEFGSAIPGDDAFACNNKLIGAYRFMATYDAFGPDLLAGEFLSARDDNGHGTHTASTAAGNEGVVASIFGRTLGRGPVSGVAPHAWVIAYKVCGDAGCYSSDSAAAVDQAIEDEVDVINFSISGGNDPFNDTAEIAFLKAYDSGILVNASAGNNGPGADTVSHRGPWVNTVGANTSDRHFLTTLKLHAQQSGERINLTGATVTPGVSNWTPLVLAGGDGQCFDNMPAVPAGNGVVCDRGTIARVLKSYNAMNAGASFMILKNLVPQGLNTDNHFIPSVHLDSDEGDKLTNFFNRHPGETILAQFDSGTVTNVRGDVMASFSSRGGPNNKFVLKPDVTTVGVQVLAGMTPLPASAEGGLPGQLFQSIQGTSMSSPHAAGVAALIKAIHPDWTPGQIKAAMLMSAATRNVFKEDGKTLADPFDYGGGSLRPVDAVQVTLTVDESAAGYAAHEFDLWNANHPSIYHPSLPGRITVQRTVHNHENKARTLTLAVNAPKDVAIIVPKAVRVPANGDATIDITIDAAAVPLGEVRFADLELKRAGQNLHMPIVFVRGEADVTIDKTCDVLSKAQRKYTCTITAQNNSFSDAQVRIVDALPKQLTVNPGELQGGTKQGNSIIFDGTLAGAQPPLVNVAITSTASPAGYIPLAAFGGTTVINGTDESIANFNVPAFQYAGESYNRIGIVSNGYIVVGGGTTADVNFINTDLPDAAAPNNVLAPFWTDLNPTFGGRMLINVLTDGVNSWIVVEWEQVVNYASREPNTFQVWIGYTQPDDISFVYGPDVSTGDGGFLTVGAENRFGNSGGTVYLNGAGTPPSPSTTGYEVDVFSTPGAAGGSHTITFNATAKKGRWQNCAELTSNLFQGTAISCYETWTE